MTATDYGLICTGSPPEPGCGAILTEEEAHYYGHACETCERRWSDRMEAWRHGGEDAELDAVFSVPKPRTN